MCNLLCITFLRIAGTESEKWDRSVICHSGFINKRGKRSKCYDVSGIYIPLMVIFKEVREMSRTSRCLASWFYYPEEWFGLCKCSTFFVLSFPFEIII